MFPRGTGRYLYVPSENWTYVTLSKITVLPCLLISSKISEKKIQITSAVIKITKNAISGKKVSFNINKIAHWL